MPETKDKDTVNHNLHKLVRDPDALKYIRGNMGLGYTLGPVPKENGGTGGTDGGSIFGNDDIKWISGGRDFMTYQNGMGGICTKPPYNDAISGTFTAKFICNTGLPPKGYVKLDKLSDLYAHIMICAPSYNTLSGSDNNSPTNTYIKVIDKSMLKPNKYADYNYLYDTDDSNHHYFYASAVDTVGTKIRAARSTRIFVSVMELVDSNHNQVSYRSDGGTNNYGVTASIVWLL